MRRILIALTLAAVALPSLAHADDASKKAKVEQILLITKSDKTFNMMVENGMKQGEQAAMTLFGDSSKMTAKDKEIFSRFETKLLATFKAESGWETMKPELVDLYAKTYTEEQIDGILAFYKSPAGQAMIEKTPEIITQSSAIAQGHFQQMQPKLQALFQEFKKEVDAAHAPAAPTKKAP